MAYTRHNWVCGETITADLLNNIEEGIAEALECCGGGTDYSVDCERTDLGELLYCGMIEDFDEPMMDWDVFNRSEFTAIVDGSELPQSDRYDESVQMANECYFLNISIYVDGEVSDGEVRLGEYGFQPEASCEAKTNYPNNHLALYYKDTSTDTDK